MFLSNNYVLSNELTEKANIHIANISSLIKTLEESRNAAANLAFQKMGNCTFLKKDSKLYPMNIRNYLNGYHFTDMSDKIPSTYLRTELGVSYDKIVKAFKVNGIEVKEETISGKRFTVFPKEFANKMKDKTWYVLNVEDYNECLKNGDIDGGISLGKGKYVTWY